MLDEVLIQAAKAAAYYATLIVLMRVAGKRLAGQTTTFDLLVLITLGVVLQSTALQEGTANAAVFVITVLSLHRLTAHICSRSAAIRHLEQALNFEGISRAELLAGLRKLGFENADGVKLATLEETGHISAIER